MWPLHFLSFLDLRLLITLWYFMAIVLSVLPRFTTFDYPFGILWSLYCLSFLDLWLLITSLVFCGHCIVCPSSIYDFWLPLWYLLVIVLSVLPPFMTSDYIFGILWPLYCLSLLDLRLLITPLVSCGHCIVCPSSIYDFWLPIWYLVAIVLSVLPRFTTFDYPFGMLWSLYFLSFLDLWLLITPLVSCGHCIVCPSSIYDFWLPLWYLVVIVLSVLPRFTTSDYSFGILWTLYCLSFLNLRLLITPLVSCGDCIVCPSSIYDFCLPPWYRLAIVLSVLPRFTTSDYPLVSCGHCIVCPSSIYDFWLPLWYLVAIVLSVLPWFTTSDYPFGILWLLYCLSFLDLWLLITPFVSCGHCTVYPSSIYDFWLPLSYLVAIVLSILPRLMTCHYLFGILWPLYCLSLLDLRLLITPLDLVVIVLSALPRFTTSDYPFGIMWPLYCLSFLDLRFLITPLVSCGHYIVFPSSIYDFWLPLWYLVDVVFSVLPRFSFSDYPFGILWPLYFLSFLDLRFLITPLVSCGHCVVCPSSIYDFWLPLWYLVVIVMSVLPRFTTSDYPFGILWPLYCLSFLDFVLSVIPRFTTYDYPLGILWPLYCLSFLDLWLLITPFVSCGHCTVYPSSIDDLSLHLWYLAAIVLSVPLRFTISDYPFGILWPLHCLSFLDLRLLITPLVSCSHCIVCPSSIYDFWLPLWYLVAIVLSVIPRFCIVCHSSIHDLWLPSWYLVAIVWSVLPRFATSDYPFGILWPLYCLSFLDLRLLITPFVSCGHYIVFPSSIYDFWLPLWYLVAIAFSVLPRFTISDYPFGIMWPLYCLSFLDLRLLITPLVSCGHCTFCPSSIYDLWLPLWYLVAIVLSFLPRFMTSDYPFRILWPLYCLSFLDWWLVITSLVSCGHCIVCPSSIYDFWLPLWSHVAIVLSVLPRFTISDYPFGVLWPLYCLSLLDLRLLITPLVTCGRCVFCPSSIYVFWLPVWYLVAIVLSIRPRFTTSDYPFGILWSLYCLSFLDLRLLITPLVSCGHCIVCPSSIYDFWLPLWYLVAIVLSVLPPFTTSVYPLGIVWPLYCLSFLDLRLLITLWYLVAIVLSVLPRFTTSDYPFGILWPLYCLSFLDLTSDYPFGILWLLYCLSFLDLWLLITPFVSCGHCTVYPSSIDDLSLPLWYLVAIVLSVPPRLTTSDYPFGSCGHCVVCPSSIYDFWLPLWYHVAIVLSVLPRFTISDYPFGVLWPLYCLSLLDLRLLITPLVSCGRCIFCPSSIYVFWLPLWYLVAIVFSVLPRFTISDYPFGILWPLHCLSFLDLRLLITPLVSCSHCNVCPSSIYDFWLPLWYLVAIVLSVIPRFCIVCHSSIYDLWLHSWYLVAIALSVLTRFMTSDYSFRILWPLYCLSFLDWWLVIIFGILAIVLSVPPRFTISDYPFGILWPLHCLSFLDLRLLITPLVSCSHCIVCPSSIYDFWLPLWYLVAIVLSVIPRFCIVCHSSIYDLWLPSWYLVAIVWSVLPRFATSDYPFGILWPLYCLSFLDLRLLITPFVSCGHCIVCPSSIYDFWLHLWYFVAIVLSVPPRFTTSYYPFGILWTLYCLSFLDLRLLITHLVSCGHCVVCPSSIYDFWLPLWYVVVIVFSVLPRFMTSDYPFGILWPLYCLSFLDLRLLITPLVSCGHCIVCPSSIYDFWLLLWYLVDIVLSVLPQFTTSDYPFGILWRLYCLSFLHLRLLFTPLVSCGHCIVCPS